MVKKKIFEKLRFHDGDTPMLGTDPDVVISITLSNLRGVIVRGCINAINKYKIKS